MDEDPVEARASTESDEFLAICRYELEPDPEQHQAGRSAFDLGCGIHEGPQPEHTVAALSWRIGWNDRALQMTGVRGKARNE